MAQHIHSDVQEIRESPRDGERISLVLVVQEGQIRTISEHVQRLDGQVTEVLPSGVLTVDVPERSVDDLCGNELINSISPDGEIRILA